MSSLRKPVVVTGQNCLLASSRPAFSARLQSVDSRQTLAISLFHLGIVLCLAAISGGTLLAQGLGTTGDEAPQSSGAGRETVMPAITGTDGSQTGIAPFFGNFTAIKAPAGAVTVFRNLDCSLSIATGTYTIHPNFAYTQTELAGNYERVLHSEAQLTTTPDVFAKGCEIQPSPGFGSQPGIFVGQTTTGVNVFAGLGLVYPAIVNGVYVLTGRTTFALSSFQDSSAGNLATADLNKDGNGDLVIVDNATASAARVTVMLGNADGTFQNGVAYPIAGNYSVAAVIDDVNGDGKLDIVAVSGDQQISVLLGKGDGTFQAEQSFAAPTLPGFSSAAATPILNFITADLRGIGKKDIIGSNGVVLLGNGNGTFTAAAAPAFPYFSDNTYALGPSLASGDLNNDGKLDVVVSGANKVSTWIGKGDGTFTAGRSYASVNSDGLVSVEDLDGDGNADILVGLGDGGAHFGDQGSPGLLYALMGNGDGTFRGAPELNSGSYNGNNLVDLNGDGLPDLVTQNATTGALTVQLGNGKGAFTPGANISPQTSFSLNGYNFTMGSSAQASSFAVGDVTGDGKPDVVFVDNGLTAINPGSGFPITYSYPVYFVAIGNGDGTFQTAVPYAFPKIAPAADFDISNVVSSMQIADVNHDGHNDLVLAYDETAGGSGAIPYNRGIVVLPGNGNGTFKAPVITSTFSSTTAPTTAIVPKIVNIGELNGDLFPDLIVNTSGSTIINFQLQTQLEAFIGNGDGTFKAPTTIAVGADEYATVLVDLNKDNKLDLAVLAETSAAQAELVILPGNGDGTFGTAAVSNLAGGDAIRSSGLAGGDFDADGNVDLALLDPHDYSGIFYGKGDGTFASVPITGAIAPKDLINVANGAPAVAVDLNKDGKPDILAGSISLLNIAGSTPVLTAATTTGVTASQSSVPAGTSVTFTATVAGASGSTGTPTGTVTFYDGATTLGPGTLASGVAKYSTNALSVGAHAITATYGGDTNFSGSTSTIASVTVTAAPGFALSNGGGISIAAGATTGNTSTITITPSGGFTGSVALTAALSASPAGATNLPTFSFGSTTPVNISGATAGTGSLTVTTTPAATATLVRPGARTVPWYAASGATLACLLLFGIQSKRRRWRNMLGMLVLLALLACGMLSCGGSSKTTKTIPGTTAGSYTVTVTGTGTVGSTTHTTAVNLTVN